MRQLDINCDVGEGVNNESQIFPFIQSCNIACGGHAGDIQTMSNIVDLAIKYQVKIGAHPSYPDRENFGRKSMNMEFNDLKTAIQNQLNSLKKIVEEKGSKLHHIKPHGALYNDLSKNKKLSLQFLNIIFPYKSEIKLYVPYNSEIEKCAINEGFFVVYEAFADRNYNDDLSLVSRNEKEAVISNIDAVVKHVFEMLNNGFVTTITGKKIAIKASTFCVHSDTKNVVEIVRNLNKKTDN